MATKLKVVETDADIVPAPTLPEFAPAPTRKQVAGWTAERQRTFIAHLALTGHAAKPPRCSAKPVLLGTARLMRFGASTSDGIGRS